MKWPWSGYRGRRRAGDRAGPESRTAKGESTDRLRKLRAQRPEVNRAADSLRRSREQNHFGEAMMALFRGDQ